MLPTIGDQYEPTVFLLFARMLKVPCLAFFGAVRRAGMAPSEGGASFQAAPETAEDPQSHSGCAGGATRPAQSRSWAPPSSLRYLNDRTYLTEDPADGCSPLPGSAFSDELRAARAAGSEILMLHENDVAKGGCEFGALLQKDPWALA